MFWVVQNNIFKESGQRELMSLLKRKNIPHLEVKVVPFFDMLLPSDFDSHTFSGSIQDVVQLTIDPNEPIIVLGATSISRIAKDKGWFPGTFLNDNFHFSIWQKAYGKHLLNEEALVDTFESIAPNWDAFFARPCEDTKDFSGTIFSKETFIHWRNELLRADGGCAFATADVMISPLQSIEAEYRFFIVDKKIASLSQYKQGDSLHKSIDVPIDVQAFALEMANKWQPARAFVLDIAKTPNGLKVIEVNNFNSAGFYAANIEDIIDAVENMFF